MAQLGASDATHVAKERVKVAQKIGACKEDSDRLKAKVEKNRKARKEFHPFITNH